jgi:hypothetical protein
MLDLLSGGNDAPPAPNFTQAAEKTAAENRKLLTQYNYANRPNQFTPFGSTTWNVGKIYDPSTKQYVPSWTQNVQLDPGLQKALESQISLQRGRSSLAGGMLGRVASEFGRPVNFEGQFGKPYGLKYDPMELRNRAMQYAYEQETSRLDPKFAESSNQLEIKLRGQGLRPGDQAYDAAIANFERAKTDAYQGARRQAFALGQGEAGQLFEQQVGTANYANQIRAQRINELLKQRGLPLNEMNALLSGQQVSLPEMQSFTGAGQGTGADYVGAAQNQYQSGVDAYNAGQMGKQGLLDAIISGASLFGGFA